jgi:hypothetical protein
LKASRPLLAAAAAAGLLAAGCDYWKNLVDDKIIATTSLTVDVRDAYFPQEPMESAHCTDGKHGIDFTTDRSGRAVLHDVPTGIYSLHCSMPQWYYDTTATFAVRAEGGTAVVNLLRRGGADWYPEEEEKWVRIQNPENRIRFPGKVNFDAFPFDTTGVLRYQWEFSGQKRFNQYFSSIRSANPALSLVTDTSKTSEGEDVVTLTIHARPKGRPEYTIGSYVHSFRWVRNKAPICSVWANAYSSKVGCKGAQRPEYVIVHYLASDPDGNCESVVFDSKDPLSSIGVQHLTRYCNDPNNHVRFDLTNPFPKGQEEVDSMANYLTVSAWDDNGEHTDNTLIITTKSNAIPKVTSGRINPGTVFFTGEPISYWISGSDEDGQIRDMYFDWGNDERSYKPLKEAPAKNLKDTISYNYRNPGTVRVTARIIDDCDDTTSYATGEPLTIRRNSDPVIAFTPESPDYTFASGKDLFQFRLAVTDQDVRDKLDKMTTTIDWGDGQTETIARDTASEYSLLMRHHYENSPAAGEYQIRVEVFDSHSGHAEKTLPVPAFQTTAKRAAGKPGEN